MRHRILSLLLVMFTAIAYAQPIATAGPDTALCSGPGLLTPLNVSVTGGTTPYTYAWSQDNWLTNYTISNPWAGPIVTTTYVVTVTDAASQTAIASTTVTIKPKPIVDINFYPQATVCSGSSIELHTQISSTMCGPGVPTNINLLNTGLGGITIPPTDTTYHNPNILSNIQKSQRHQILFNGVSNSPNGKIIKAISFRISNLASSAAIENLQIRLSCTSQDTLGFDWENSSSTLVYSVASYTPVNGWNNFTLQTPYHWSTENLLVEICSYNPITFGNLPNKLSSVISNKSYLYQSSNTDLCGSSSTPIRSNVRPSFSFLNSEPDFSPTYTYNWLAEGDTEIDNPTSTIIQSIINDTTTYHVIVTNNFGCSDTGSLQVIPNVNFDVPAIDTLLVEDAICGQSGGSITATVTGCEDINYSWSNGAIDNPQTNLTPGDYVLTVTDCNGCTASKSTHVNLALGLIFNIITDDISCSGGSDGGINLTVSGGIPPYDYFWDNGETTEDLSDLSAGIYTVTVFDAGGCSETDTVEIFDPMLLSIDSSGGAIILCNGNSTGAIDQTTYGGYLPYTHLWSNFAATEDVANLTAGTYSVTTTDMAGCTVSRTFVIGEPTPVTAVYTHTNATCVATTDGSITISASGGTPPYAYSLNGSPTQSDSVFFGLTAGTYTIVLYDANGCAPTLPGAIIITAPVLTISFNNIVEPACGASNGTVCAVPQGTGPFAYSWNNSATTSCISGLAAGIYTVTITDAAGCVGIDTIILQSSNSPITITADSLFNVSCFGGNNGAIYTTATGGTAPYAYQWSNFVGSDDVTGLTAGTYFLLVTDNNDCVSADTFIVIEPLALIVSTNTTNVSCNGGNDGSGCVIGNGGMPPYTFEWGNQTINNCASSLVAGPYTITITDGAACSVTASLTINEPSALVVDSIATTDISCNGLNDGKGCFYISGGTGGYSYLWSNFVTTACYNNLTSGPYTITVTDNALCTITAALTINEPSSMVLGTPTIFNASCFGATNGSICVNTSGGIAPYSYTWATNPQAPNDACLNNAPAGTYTITVSDANGCDIITSYSIIQPTQLTVTITNTGDGIMPDTITSTVSGGIPPYSYVWNNSTNLTEAIITIQLNDIELIVSDANNCQGVDTVVLGCPDTCVWPGDADYSGLADNNDLLAIGLGYGATGSVRIDQSISYTPHQSAAWADTLIDGTNYKHIDCNGDGIINSDDTLAILQNYGLTHPRSGQDDVRGGVPVLRISIVPDTLEDGQTVIAHISLGDNNATATDVYGLAFTFNFDPLVVDTNEVYISFNNNSWLCNTANDHIDMDRKFRSEGKIYTALTRIDHTTRSGGGEIGSVSMKITTGNINGKDLAYYSMLCYVTDLRVIDNHGNKLDIDAYADSSTIQYEPTGINEINWQGEVNLYPNPARQQLVISSSKSDINGIQLMNLLGESLLVQKGMSGKKALLDVSTLSDGIYILKLNSGNSSYHAKFMVAK